MARHHSWPGIIHGQIIANVQALFAAQLLAMANNYLRPVIIYSRVIRALRKNPNLIDLMAREALRQLACLWLAGVERAISRCPLFAVKS
jgi:hypothetical protein